MKRVDILKLKRKRNADGHSVKNTPLSLSLSNAVPHEHDRDTETFVPLITVFSFNCSAATPAHIFFPRILMPKFRHTKNRHSNYLQKLFPHKEKSQGRLIKVHTSVSRDF